MPRCLSLLNILDLYDPALGLRVLWILHYRYVQLVLILAERDVGRAIPGGNFECVQKLALRRYLQDLAAKPFSHINVTLAIDLHAIRSQPPRFDLVRDKQ